MNLTVLGTSPSFPNPGGASSSYLVRGGETELLIDCGHGAVGKLRLVTDAKRLNGIVISHMHPDHFFDLVPLHYLFRFLWPSVAPLPLWLPDGGIETLERLAAAVDLGEEFLTGQFVIREYDPNKVLEIGNIEIRFAPAHHFVRAYEMRISETGIEEAAIAYSSDTGMSEDVAALLRGVRLAVIEATELSYADPQSDHGHLTGALAGTLAARARVDRLLLTHYPDTIADQVLTAASVSFGRPAELAQEGETYVV